MMRPQCGGGDKAVRSFALKCYSWKVERGLSEFVCCPPFLLLSLSRPIYLSRSKQRNAAAVGAEMKHSRRK